MSLFEPGEGRDRFQPLDLLAPGRRDTVEKIEREIVADEKGRGPRVRPSMVSRRPPLVRGFINNITFILAIDKLLRHVTTNLNKPGTQVHELEQKGHHHDAHLPHRLGRWTEGVLS